jgi:predicted metalloendopeptidase
MLQAPFFDPKTDPAINYGAIGSVIGHELTHSFDDQGRESDAEGRLRDWWTPEDAARFKTNADLLSIQYSAMEPLPGLHLKGDVTLGENIADLGGVTIDVSARTTCTAARQLYRRPTFFPRMGSGSTGEASRRELAAVGHNGCAQSRNRSPEWRGAKH